MENTLLFIVNKTIKYWINTADVYLIYMRTVLLGQENQMTFIVLQVHTLINVFKGSALGFYHDKNHNSGQTLHTGPLRLILSAVRHIANAQRGVRRLSLNG